METLPTSDVYTVSRGPVLGMLARMGILAGTNTFQRTSPGHCSKLFCVCMVLGFELRAYTLSHSTSPFL
jgi:hypothetical protein